ncbi:HGH1 family protein [Abortiporus biennis]
MSEAELRQLIPFLHEKNPQVRQIALANLLGHTAQDTDIVRSLKLLCRDQLATAHDAFRALINLSDNSLLTNALSERSFILFLVSYILNVQSTLADLASMLLSNMTASATTCATLLSITIPVLPDPKSPSGYYPTESRSGTSSQPVPYPTGEPQNVPALPLLIDAFEQAANVVETDDKTKHKRKGELHFLSSVFANVSVTPAGRMFFLTPTPSDPLKPESPLEYPLSKILVFTEHKDVIRRGGVASTLKNCAFHVQAHKALLTPESEQVAVPPSTVTAPGMDILPYLLLPLAGPEEFDLEDQELLPAALQFLPSTKIREPDSALRLIHVETLLLLCTTHWGRQHLRANGVYQIIRALHENETVDDVAAHIERLVNYLKRDEGPDTKLDGAEHFGAMEPSSSSAAVTGASIQEIESDDEDNTIEEI